MPNQTLILIPARLASTRLPNKPLADINGKAMILRVAEQAIASNCGQVAVASGDDAILELIQNNNILAIKTYGDHQSGSDRIFEAFNSLPDKNLFDFIVNLQGDLPNIKPDYIRRTVSLLQNSEAEIATLANLITEAKDINNPNFVKIIATQTNCNDNALRAIYFTRAAAPYGHGDYYHHIGIYAYRKAALQKFISLPASNLEKREKLEQLRAIENNMTIIFDTVEEQPIGVDCADDLARIRKVLI